MDQSRFDTLTKTFATSRRQAIKLALGGSVAGLLGLAGGTSGNAARRGFSGPFSTPTPATDCTIDEATIPANTINAANTCQRCDPALDPNAWSPIFGAFCGDGAQVCCNGECCPATHCCSLSETCTPCRCEIDGSSYDAGTTHPTSDCLVCDPSQSTTGWSPVLDRTTCGGVAGRVCCNGECCSPTECCEGAGACIECGPHCTIAGEDIPAGTTNPAIECESCDPEQSLNGWSPLDDGRACNQGDGCCGEGVCGTCFCEIDGDPVANGDRNPNNDCEACRYFANPSDWTNRDNSAPCGNDGDRRCCDGDCCPPNQCCTLDGCAPCCQIGSDTVADGVVNRANTCQVCDASRDPDDWITLDNGEACGPTGNSECCEGACCPSGQCCRNGACGLCDCEIDGRRVAPDVVNENNLCEVCKPALNRFDWSAVAPDTSCGSNGASCCGRDCCASDLCCLLDACGECLCSIENEIVRPGVDNPAVDCQVCDPGRDPFDWSTATNGAACGDAGDQKCCNGVCCEPGQCCLGSACRSCGCLIAEQEIAPQTIDPANDCQICDPTRDPLDWSLRDEGTACGDSGVQCCSSGECAVCGCLIGGLPVPDGETNPENECEQCDRALDPSGWTPRNETFACGPAGDRICCNGVCCQSGEHCNLDDVCGSGCLIDGVAYAEFQRKPGNFCEYCDPRFPNQWSPSQGGDCPPACLIDGELVRYGTQNPANLCQVCRGGDDWSPSPELFCGEGLAQICCNGSCCDQGACCSADGVCAFDGCEQQGCVIDGVQYQDGELNPESPCQICQLSASTTSWTPRFAACGPTGEQFCCEGVCCDLGACCNPSGVCDYDACETCVIGGQLWFPEDRNPANGCEICHANSNKFSWTPLPDFSWCDEMQITTCCVGICCPPGEACRDGTCQPL